MPRPAAPIMAYITGPEKRAIIARRAVFQTRPKPHHLNSRPRIIQTDNSPPNLPNRPLLALPRRLPLPVPRRPNRKIQPTPQLRLLDLGRLPILPRIGRRDQPAGLMQQAYACRNIPLPAPAFPPDVEAPHGRVRQVHGRA